MNDMLESVAFGGHASRPKWKIARWYGQSNFSVNIRRDLRERWRSHLTEELEFDEIPMLKIAEVSGDIFLMRGKDFFPDEE